LPQKFLPPFSNICEQGFESLPHDEFVTVAALQAMKLVTTVKTFMAEAREVRLLCLKILKVRLMQLERLHFVSHFPAKKSGDKKIAPKSRTI
jgi:hypothetical protein